MVVDVEAEVTDVMTGILVLKYTWYMAFGSIEDVSYTDFFQVIHVLYCSSIAQYDTWVHLKSFCMMGFLL